MMNLQNSCIKMLNSKKIRVMWFAEKVHQNQDAWLKIGFDLYKSFEPI